jgi:hypothetical protein
VIEREASRLDIRSFRLGDVAVDGPSPEVDDGAVPADAADAADAETPITPDSADTDVDTPDDDGPQR